MEAEFADIAYHVGHNVTLEKDLDLASVVLYCLECDVHVDEWYESGNVLTW